MALALCSAGDGHTVLQAFLNNLGFERLH